MNFVIDNFSLNTYDYSNFTNYLINLEKIDISFLNHIINEETIFTISNKNVALLLSKKLNINIKPTDSKFRFSHVQDDLIYYLHIVDKKAVSEIDLNSTSIQLFRIGSTFMAPHRDLEAEDKRDEELEKVENLIISCA